MNEVKFSVIIPLYNKEKYIGKTLKSVLNQKYKKYEVIIVNDGSTDASVHIVKKHANEKVKIITQKNSGVSAARNRGIKNAKYEYVAFLDADDWWEPNYLMNMHSLIKRYPRQAIYGAKYSVKKKGKILDKSFFPDKDKFIIFDLCQYGINRKDIELPLHTSSVVLRKDVAVEQKGFDERVSYYEDYDLFIRMSINSKVAYFNGETQSIYNGNVPANERITGNGVPIRKHFLYHTAKYKDIKTNDITDRYIDIFKALALISYMYDSKNEKKYYAIKRTIKVQNYMGYHYIRKVLRMKLNHYNLVHKSKLLIKSL